MSNIELQSFLTKFYQLKNAGYSAHLDLHAHSGQCWVGLRAQLGQAGQQPPQHHPQQRPRLRRSPAYARRQERRQAARQQAAAAVPASEVSAAEAAADEVDAETATEEVAEEIAENAVTTEEVEPSESPPPAEDSNESSPPPEEVTESSPPPEDVPKTTQEVNPKFVVEEVAQNVANETLFRSEERVSVSLYLAGERFAEYSEIMKPDRNKPAPFWFCEDLGTLKNHHGNAKFFISEQVRAFIGHHSHNVLTHTQFLSRLWSVMSWYPLNDEEFIPMPAFLDTFGRELVMSQGYPVKWTKLRIIMQDHVYFNSSLVGVFSGRRHPTIRFY